MASKDVKIIIKKVHKNHAAAHGGSWKVAYADFVTAMMAFFLLMWLLSMVSPEKKVQMADYFKHFSLFDKSGSASLNYGEISATLMREEEVNEGSGDSSEDGDMGDIAPELREHLFQKIQQDVSSLAEGIRDRIFVEATKEGVRMHVVDNLGSPLFAPGSSKLTEQGKRVLRSLISPLKSLPNGIVIEGHTDASGAPKDQTENWELSILRACSAKTEFVASGYPISRIRRVEGYAHTMPLFTDDLSDPRNRRISLVVLFEPKSTSS